MREYESRENVAETFFAFSRSGVSFTIERNGTSIGILMPHSEANQVKGITPPKFK